jgi:hypothetical protein
MRAGPGHDGGKQDRRAPGAAPIGGRVVEVSQLSQLFLADPLQAHRPHRSLQLHGVLA